MDLGTREVAELLNVSEGDVVGWIEEGKIPAYKMSNEYRLSRREVEDWIVRNDVESLRGAMEDGFGEGGVNQFSLFRALHRGFVFEDIDGTTKEEVLRNTTKRLGNCLEIDGEVLGDLLIDREGKMSTGLGRGVAVPHAREFLLNTHYDVVTVVYPKEPLEFGSLDGERVHTLFFVFACEDGRHLNILAKLAHLVNNQKGIEFLRQRPTKGELLGYVKEMEGRLG